MTSSSSSDRPIAIATGTRADWGLLSPLARELSRRGERVEVLACNMHLRHDCGHTVDEIRADGFEPYALIATPGAGVEVTAAATAGFGKALSQLRPRTLVVLGDRIEMLGAATAALIEGVPIVHIAGGTVSEGAFDDSIRHAISKMSTLHLTETECCRERLLRMGESPLSVITTGAIGVENVLSTPLMTRRQLEQSLGWSLHGRIVVATLHAATLDPMSPAMQMHEFVEGLSAAMARLHDVRVLMTYPNNDTDPGPLVEEMQRFAARWDDRVLLVPSLGRVRYMSALHLAAAVAGNSSSGLVEVPSVGIPTLDVGIRQAGRECGPSVLHTGSRADQVARGLEHVLGDEMQRTASRRVNPYHREGTARLMADAITGYAFHPFPTKKFYQP